MVAVTLVVCLMIQKKLILQSIFLVTSFYLSVILIRVQTTLKLAE